MGWPWQTGLHIALLVHAVFAVFIPSHSVTQVLVILVLPRFWKSSSTCSSTHITDTQFLPFFLSAFSSMTIPSQNTAFHPLHSSPRMPSLLVHVLHIPLHFLCCPTVLIQMQPSHKSYPPLKLYDCSATHPCHISLPYGISESAELYAISPIS